MAEPVLESGAGKFDARTEYAGGPPLSGRLGKEDMPVDVIGGAYTGENFHPILPPEKRTHIQLRPEDIPQGTKVLAEQNIKMGGGGMSTVIFEDYVNLLTNTGWYRGQTFKMTEDEDLAVRRVIVRAIKRQLKEENARVRASLHQPRRQEAQVQEPSGPLVREVRVVPEKTAEARPEAERPGA